MGFTLQLLIYIIYLLIYYEELARIMVKNPTISCWQAGGPGELVVLFQSLSKGKRRPVSQLSSQAEERANSLSLCLLSFSDAQGIGR